jgi:hypothetical protein
MSADIHVLPAPGWYHSIKVGDGEVWTEPLVGWLVLLDGHLPRAVPITRSSAPGEVWIRDAGDDIELPEAVAAALGVDEVEEVNESWTRPTRRWSD